MDKPLSSRRDFLSGKAALCSAASLITTAIDELIPSSEPAKLKPAKPLMVVRRRAMACQFEVRLESSAGSEAVASAMEALDRIEAIEDQLTVYRDESELITINRLACDGPTNVPEDLVPLFELADRLWQESEGAFDITSGPLSRLWGFDRRDPKLPDAELINTCLRHVGWQNVKFDPKDQMIEYLLPEIEINFNSLGKGYALDEACRMLAGANSDNFLIQGGQSSVIARGTNPRFSEDGWPIGIRNPYDPSKLLTQVVLKDESLSSSGNATQGFWHEERRYGHLIDPRTGWPNEGVLMATAIVSGNSQFSAAEADALSTAFYLMGEEETEKYCQTHPEVRAILLMEDGQESSEVRLATYG